MKAHQDVLERLNLHNRTGVVEYALCNGLISSDENDIARYPGDGHSN